mgnify:CR=1 FL=1
MAVKKGGLGKGLDSLIQSSPSRPKTAPKPEVKEKIVEKVVEKVVEKPVEQKIKLSLIEPNREQPRKKFDEEALQELSDSIKQYGIIQPLVVKKNADYYEIIAGERRWRAAKMAGLTEVPVIIKEYTEQEIVEISLIENIQRENLNPIEEAIAYKRLLDEFHLKQEEVAKRVAKSRTTVTNSLRLLKLDEKVQQMVIEEKLTSGHVRALLAIEDKNAQYNIAKKVYDEKLNVRDTEKLVKLVLSPKAPKVKKKLTHEEIYHDMEERMKEIFGSKVSIQRKSEHKGKIEIEYYSDEELERILDVMNTMQ